MSVRTIVVITILICFSSISSLAALRYWVGGASAIWNSTANWSATSGGTNGASVPSTGDDVIFDEKTANNIVVRGIQTRTIRSLTVTGNTSVTFRSVGSNQTLSINVGDASNALIIAEGSVLVLGSDTATFTIDFPATNSQTGDISGTLTVNIKNSFNASNINVIPGISVTGTINSNGGSLIGNSNFTSLNFGSSASYYHSNTGGSIPSATWNSTSTITITSPSSSVSGWSQTFGNVAVSSTGTVTINGSISVIAGVLDLKQGALFIAAGVNLTLNGTVVHSSPGTGTLAGTTTSTLTIGGAGALGELSFSGSTPNLGTLTLNRTGTSPSVTLGTNLTVSNTIILTSGKINTNGNTLIFNGGRTASPIAGYVYNATAENYIANIGAGGFQWNIPSGTVAGNYLLPVGPAGTVHGFRPVTINPGGTTSGVNGFKVGFINQTTAGTVSATELPYPANNSAQYILNIAVTGVLPVAASLTMEYQNADFSNPLDVNLTGTNVGIFRCSNGTKWETIGNSSQGVNGNNTTITKSGVNTLNISAAGYRPYVLAITGGADLGGDCACFGGGANDGYAQSVSSSCSVSSGFVYGGSHSGGVSNGAGSCNVSLSILKGGAYEGSFNTIIDCNVPEPLTFPGGFYSGYAGLRITPCSPPAVTTALGGPSSANAAQIINPCAVPANVLEGGAYDGYISSIINPCLVPVTVLVGGPYDGYISDVINPCTSPVTVLKGGSYDGVSDKFRVCGGLDVSVNSINTACNQCTGSASVTVTGGTSPYSYSWSPSGGTSSSATALCAETYTITIADAGGQTATAELTVSEYAPPMASCSGGGVTCNNGSNGTAEVTAGFGTSPYAYIWSNNATTSSVSGLTAGTYSVTVTDANNCSSTCSYAVTEPAAIIVTAGNNGPVCKDSALSLSAGFIAGASYSWSGPLGFSTGVQNPDVSASATLAMAGTYSVTATVDGCTSAIATTEVIVNNCVSSLSFNVGFFIQGYYMGNDRMSHLLKLLDISNDPNDVDTAIVELHSSEAPYNTIVASYKGVVKSDGNMQCAFDLSTSGQKYYIVIKHRNSIPVWSADSVLVSPGGSYDFRSAEANTYGNNVADLGGGRYGIYSGDIVQDEAINITDKYSLQNILPSFTTGSYNVNDITGDGFVDEDDLRVMRKNAGLSVTIQRP